MYRNIVKLAVAVALIFSVNWFSAQPAKAQVASHIIVGDSTVTCKYSGNTQQVGPDNDGGTGQIVEVLACPTVEISNVFSYQYVEYSTANLEAAVNDLLLNGCGSAYGCGSVRLFKMTSTGTTSQVINAEFPKNPAISITLKGKAGNHAVFHVKVEDVGLWDHSVAFGDGAESVFGFSGAAREFDVSHDYFWEGGTFDVVLTATTQYGEKISQTIEVFIPHP